MDILVVDYKLSSAADRFVDSIRKTGFCVLKNHTISSSLIEKAFFEWQTFFSLSEDKKRHFLFKRDFNRVQGGFFPLEISETAKGFSVKDLKEFFHYYPCEGKLPPCIGEATINLRHELILLAKNLLCFLEKSLPKSIKDQLSCSLEDMVDEQYQTLLRVLHYPPLPYDIPEGSVRAAAHEDIDLMTLLVSPSASGLQAQDKSGIWHSVPFDKKWSLSKTIR